MPTISLDLDKVRVTYPKEKLRLFITPSLKFDCPVDGILDHIQQSDILQALKSAQIWPSRGFACQINFRINLLGTVFDNHEHAIEELGTSIRNAELWNQLSISPSLEIPGSSETSKHTDITIKISHMQPSVELSKNTISLSAIPADTKPPDGVPCIGLTSIELGLEFRSISTNSRRNPKKPRLSKELMLLDDLNPCNQRELLLPKDVNSESLSILPSSPPACLSEMMQMASENKGSLPDKEGDAEVIEDNEEEEDILLLETNHIQLLTPPSSAQPDTLPTTLKRSMNHEDKGLPLKLDLPIALKLTDFGLRTLIGGRPTKAIPGVSLLKPEQKNSLSDLVPSLWSPGYLKAVSQRSRFLPILSRTMSTSILKNAQSPGLKKALFDLAELPASPLLISKDKRSKDGGFRLQSPNQRVARVVQARAWKMTQQSLFDPLAARRLHRIDMPVDDSSRRQEDLLADETKGLESATFSSLANDLAGFMEEEHFEDFLEEEEWTDFEGDLFCDFALDLEAHKSQNSVERWGTRTGEQCIANGVHDGSLEIPNEFWKDLQLEPEDGGCLDDGGLFVPESFWEDLRMEEKGEGNALGSQNSDMLL